MESNYRDGPTGHKHCIAYIVKHGVLKNVLIPQGVTIETFDCLERNLRFQCHKAVLDVTIHIFIHTYI